MFSSLDLNNVEDQDHRQTSWKHKRSVFISPMGDGKGGRLRKRTGLSPLLEAICSPPPHCSRSSSPSLAHKSFPDCKFLSDTNTHMYKLIHHFCVHQLGTTLANTQANQFIKRKDFLGFNGLEIRRWWLGTHTAFRWGGTAPSPNSDQLGAWWRLGSLYPLSIQGAECQSNSIHCTTSGWATQNSRIPPAIKPDNSALPPLSQSYPSWEN